MRIVFSCDYYSSGMGYHENIIPKTLSLMGHDVFIVSSTLQVYGDCDFYDNTYSNFLGNKNKNSGIETIDGVTVIRLKKIIWWKRIKLVKNRNKTILKLKPDIVYSYDPVSLQTSLLSLLSLFSKFTLYTATHTVASVYPAYYDYQKWSFFKKVYLFVTDSLLGYITSIGIKKCYCMTPDGLEISKRFFKINKSKIELISLPIDVSLFYPLYSKENEFARNQFRESLNISDKDVLCIYTGRMTTEKNPLCLAQAIDLLRNNGHSIKGLFLGEGEQYEQISKISGCIIMPFKPYKDLSNIYRSADIGVWPRQESLSMNDAAACGIPIIVSNKIKAIERVDGNGLTYIENDPVDLSKVIISLMDENFRNKLGKYGVEKINCNFSHVAITDIYLSEFNKNLKK